MLKIRILAPALAAWMAISFTLCVVVGIVAPGLPIAHSALALFFPGFSWLSIGSFVLGFVESVLYGALGGALFVVLYNYFARLVTFGLHAPAEQPAANGNVATAAR